MQEIIQQIGALMLSAVPTILLFTVLVAAYRILVQGPLSATLKERHARTEGAVEQARQAIARAETRAAEYAAQLRQARNELFKQRELRMQQWTIEREAALEEARKAASQRISQAKVELDAETVVARQTIEAVAAELGKQVVGVILPAGGTL